MYPKNSPPSTNPAPTKTIGSAAPVSTGRRAAFGLICPRRFMRIMASRSSSSQANRNCQPRRHVADLVLTVLARVDQHSAKRIQLFHRHRKFFAQQVHQPWYASRASRHHDALNVFPARGCAEEVECLLNFERQYIRNAP